MRLRVIKKIVKLLQRENQKRSQIDSFSESISDLDSPEFDIKRLFAPLLLAFITFKGKASELIDELEVNLKFLDKLPGIDTENALTSGSGSSETSVESVDLNFSQEDYQALSFKQAPVTPVAYTGVSSEFGMREHPISHEQKFHRGIDYAAQEGTMVYAITSGTIIKIGWDPTGGGNRIWIQHDVTDSQNKAVVCSVYMHLSEFAPTLVEGSRVYRGQYIGKVGQTGNTTGAHLHLGITVNGKYVNPEVFLAQSENIMVRDVKSIYSNEENSTTNISIQVGNSGINNKK